MRMLKRTHTRARARAHIGIVSTRHRYVICVPDFAAAHRANATSLNMFSKKIDKYLNRPGAGFLKHVHLTNLYFPTSADNKCIY